MTKYQNLQDVEVDIDFLNKVLDLFNYENMYIEICGGEPGCVNNIDDVFKTIYNHKNVKYIQIMSNGLLRKNGVDWITDKKVFYNEHIIKEINDKSIIKFYNLELDKVKNRKYVVVTSNQTIISILNNFEYYKELGLFESRFWYKILINKTNSIKQFYQKLKEFYIKINQDDLQSNLDMIQYFKDDNNLNISKKMLCAKNSPQPAIDFESKELLHCSNFLNKTKRAKLTSINCQKQLDMELFNLGSYCKECYTFDYSSDKINCVLDSKFKKIYTNRSYWYNKFEGDENV